jgi:hypothetical protein
MKTGEAPRRLWGRRALGLALGGGIVGGIVAFVGLLMFVQLLGQIVVGPRGRTEIDPDLAAVLMLGALAYGVPCGAVLGLVIWSVWFLVRRRARVPDSDSSPPP